MPETKVTLTNWARLNNAPLLLPRASAVQWNDYVVVLASDGTALLYQAKLKLWSMLPKCHNSMNDNVPLVNYRGKILAASKQSVIEAFDVSSSTWKKMSELRDTTIVHMAVNCDTLYAYVEKKTRVFDHTPALFSLTTEGWKEQDLLSKSRAQKYCLLHNTCSLKLLITAFIAKKSTRH